MSAVSLSQSAECRGEGRTVQSSLIELLTVSVEIQDSINSQGRFTEQS